MIYLSRLSGNINSQSAGEVFPWQLYGSFPSSSRARRPSFPPSVLAKSTTSRTARGERRIACELAVARGFGVLQLFRPSLPSVSVVLARKEANDERTARELETGIENFFSCALRIITRTGSCLRYFIIILIFSYFCPNFGKGKVILTRTKKISWNLIRI